MVGKVYVRILLNIKKERKTKAHLFIVIIGGHQWGSYQNTNPKASLYVIIILHVVVANTLIQTTYFYVFLQYMRIYLQGMILAIFAPRLFVCLLVTMNRKTYVYH